MHIHIYIYRSLGVDLNNIDVIRYLQSKINYYLKNNNQNEYEQNKNQILTYELFKNILKYTQINEEKEVIKINNLNEIVKKLKHIYEYVEIDIDNDYDNIDRTN